jgi:hypothetical protein
LAASFFFFFFTFFFFFLILSSPASTLCANLKENNNYYDSKKLSPGFLIIFKFGIKVGVKSVKDGCSNVLKSKYPKEAEHIPVQLRTKKPLGLFFSVSKPFVGKWYSRNKKQTTNFRCGKDPPNLLTNPFVPSLLMTHSGVTAACEK